jgi:hypothetical protein
MKHLSRYFDNRLGERSFRHLTGELCIALHNKISRNPAANTPSLSNVDAKCKLSLCSNIHRHLGQQAMLCRLIRLPRRGNVTQGRQKLTRRGSSVCSEIWRTHRIWVSTRVSLQSVESHPTFRRDMSQTELPTCFTLFFLLGLLIDREDGDMLLRHFGWFSTDYVMLYTIR